MRENSTYLGQIVLVGTVLGLEKKLVEETKTDIQSKASMAILEGKERNIMAHSNISSAPQCAVRVVAMYM